MSEINPKYIRIKTENRLSSLKKYTNPNIVGASINLKTISDIGMYFFI